MLGLWFSQQQSETAGIILPSSMIQSCYAFLWGAAKGTELVMLHWKHGTFLKTLQLHRKRCQKLRKIWRKFMAIHTTIPSGDLPLQPSLDQRPQERLLTNWRSSRHQKMAVSKEMGKQRLLRPSWWMLLSNSKLANVFLGHFQVSKTLWILPVNRRMAKTQIQYVCKWCWYCWSSP